MQGVEIAPGLFGYDASLFVKPLGILALSDLQLGREEELRKAGGLVIDTELVDMKRRLAKALEWSGASRVLINGDLKHEFGTINPQEERSVLDLLRFLDERGVSVIVIKGNHDVLLEPILKRVGVRLLDSFSENGFFFCHGHAVPSSPECGAAKTVIIGHEHPALALSDGLRHEVVKCFLFASNHHRSLIVLPSFSRATEGTDVLRGDFLGPFLTSSIVGKSEVFLLVDAEIKRAGTVDQIRRALAKMS